MLIFAMDCLFAGMGLVLLMGGLRFILGNDYISYKDFWYLCAAFGMAIFLISRFLMGFFILWSSWD